MKQWEEQANSNGKDIGTGKPLGPEATKFDFGIYNDKCNTITHANTAYYPEAEIKLEGDSVFRSFEDLGRKFSDGEIYDSGIEEWSTIKIDEKNKQKYFGSAHFNQQTWCVACDGGTYDN